MTTLPEHCISRQCSPGECRLAWQNGHISCAEVARRKAVADSEQRENIRVADLRYAVADELGSDPPLCVAAVGVSAERAMLVRNKSQADREKEKLAGLETKAERYQKIIDAPGKTEQTLSERIADMAKRFLEIGQSNDDDSTAAARASMQLLVEQKAAEAAAQELAKINGEIEIQRLRIEHVERRTNGYVDAVIEAELCRLGPSYLKAVAEYKKVAPVLFSGLRHIGSFKDRTVVDFPRPKIDTCNRSIPDAAFEVSATAEHDGYFKSLAARLAVDPAHKVVFPLAA